MSKILRYLACLFMLIFAGNALAAGYSCPSYKTYTSCASGYYMTSSPSSTTCNTTAQAGNACRPCSVMGSNYTCSGGTTCPKLNSVTCRAGYYLPANATSCRACGGNNYYCKGGTFNVSSSAQGRRTVSSGYYSTGGTSTTRTGQSQCGAGYYCSAGVRTACSGSLQYQNAAGQTSCKTVSDGYYKSSNTGQRQCPANYRDGTGAANINACKTSCDGGTYVATANAACTSVGTGYYKGAHTVNYGSTSTRSQCPSGYRDGAATSAQSGCKMDVEAGHYVATANSETQSTCAAGTYKAAHTITYGSTSSCSACSGRTKYSAARASACKTVSSGYYTTGCNTSGNNCTGQSRCTGATYCSGGVQNSCPAQTSGWTRNGGTGWTSYTQCNQTRAATSVSSYCSAGQLKQTATSATAWGASTISTAFQAKAGAYVNGQTCSQCTADNYCTGGTTAPTDCPSGYPNSDAGATAITSCYSNSKSRAWTGSQTACTKPTGCYEVTCNACSEPACSYVAYANSAGTGDGTIKSGCSSNNEACQQTVNTVTANAGRYVSGKTCPACAVGTFQGSNDSTATSCSVCSGNTYAASTGMSSCSACPSGYTISGTAASNHDAKSDCSITCAAGTRVVTADAACTTPTGSWYTASHSVTAGSTTPAATVKACLTNYSTPNTTTRTDHDASTDCKISCAAGTRVATENATSCTTPAGNWYVGAHSVAQGSISSYSNCLTNYTISGTAAANHDTASDCKISCGGGSYIATANNTTCSDVGAGYWAAASTVSQGSAGVRNACDDGLTTIGSGAGADEVGDCGRVLNVNGEKIYLRSERKTTPSLNVSINGTTFYGNMGTSGIGALKLNSGGTTYSVYDDSME